MRAFIAMPFHPSLDWLYAIVEKNCLICGIEPRRVDRIAGVENIWDAIVEEIRNCDLVIADFSPDPVLNEYKLSTAARRNAANTNVATEAGYARALGKSVILLTSDPESLPFDWRVKLAIVYPKDMSDVDAIMALHRRLENALDSEKAKWVERKKREAEESERQEDEMDLWREQEREKLRLEEAEKREQLEKQRLEEIEKREQLEREIENLSRDEAGKRRQLEREIEKLSRDEAGKRERLEREIEKLRRSEAEKSGQLEKLQREEAQKRRQLEQEIETLRREEAGKRRQLEQENERLRAEKEKERQAREAQQRAPAEAKIICPICEETSWNSIEEITDCPLDGTCREAIIYELGGIEKNAQAEVQRNAAQRQAVRTSADGRYRAYDNGVIEDTKTGLEWYCGPDEDTDWDEANAWVSSLTVAGGGWRMPTIAELKGIAEASKRSSVPEYLDPIFPINGYYVWSGELCGKNGKSSKGGNSPCARYFDFLHGAVSWSPRSHSDASRGVAVRQRRRG